jgi:sec-independent protein translocase protein TatC
MSTLAAARGTMSLGAHLGEARRRAIRASAALLVGTVAGFALSDRILAVLRAPIETLAQTRIASLNYDSVTGAFDLKLRIALFAAVVLSSPVWLYQLTAFVSPGLTSREKGYTYGFFFSGLVLFASGCLMGFGIFPHMVEVLTGFAPAEDSTILTATYYVDFVMRFVLATGVAFVLPVFLVLLNALGMLSSATLLRSWRLIVIAIVLFSALVTPSADVLSMFFVAVPMAILFGAAVLITLVHDRRAMRRASHSEPPVAAPTSRRETEPCLD